MTFILSVSCFRQVFSILVLSLTCVLAKAQDSISIIELEKTYCEKAIMSIGANKQFVNGQRINMKRLKGLVSKSSPETQAIFKRAIKNRRAYRIMLYTSFGWLFFIPVSPAFIAVYVAQGTGAIFPQIKFIELYSQSIFMYNKDVVMGKIKE